MGAKGDDLTLFDEQTEPQPEQPQVKEIPAGIVRPLSVLHGRDGEAITTLLSIHCESKTPRILDCTHNKGIMWKGLSHRPVRMDISKEFPLDVCGDFRRMPFADQAFDVVVFDPPHLPDDAGKTCRHHDSYNVGNTGLGMDGDCVSAIFAPFLGQAKRILKSGGIVLAKIADLVHNHRQQWQQVDFVNAVRAAGMTACDMLIKIDPAAGNMMDPRWKNVKHLRKGHCYWIVARNSNRCECK